MLARVPRALFCMLLIVALSLSSAPPAHAAESPAYRSGSLLVKLRAGALTQFRLPAGARVQSALASNLYSVQVQPGDEQRMLAHLQALPSVAYAQLDHAVAAQIQPHDARYSEQWNMERIGAPEAWAVVTDTTALVVAVLDTGIAEAHPDLQGQLWRNPGEIANNGVDDDHNGFVDDVHGWHFYHTYSNGQAYTHDDSSISDANGHGTHVAGIIGATGDNGMGVTGVAWRARLMIVRVLEDDAVGWESDVIRGVNYAIANGARIVHMSLGQTESSPALMDMITQAEERGVLVVAAAGNTGNQVLFPAAYPTVLSVGASDQHDQRAGFSAFGARLDLLAPGVDILSTWNGVPYFARSGTSMAAPHVSGAAALLWTRMPNMTPAQVRRCLLQTAIDLGPPGRDDNHGWGLLNIGRALQQNCQSLTFLPLMAS
ncbi:MAG TPA: S8 family peptidase [Roseiflexaceae bacterium]|nr:S8 family peptidase [Roseiflexaceae bacterium]